MSLKQTIDKAIKQIVADAETHGKLSYGDGIKWREELTLLENRLATLDMANRPGLNPGRHIKFQVADGYANCIVTKVLKNIVHVVHVPILDGYHFNGIYQDERGHLCLPRPVAQRSIDWDEKMEILFKKKDTTV
jgi:hypothetical protein